MRALPWFLLLALALVACPTPRDRGGGGGGDDDDGSEDDDDASSDDDDASSDDDDAGSDDDDAVGDDDDAVGACGVYDPYDQVGAWWDWEYLPEYADEVGYEQQWTTEAMGPTTWRGQPVFETRSGGAMDNPTYDWFEWETSSYFVCDDEGLWSVGYESSTSWSLSGTPDSVTATGFYDQPWLLRPAGLQPGDEWHADGAGEYSDSNGTESALTVDIWYEAEAFEQVTTPAGTFEALRVRSEAADTESWFWLAPGVGHVMTADFNWLVPTSQ